MLNISLRVTEPLELNLWAYFTYISTSFFNCVVWFLDVSVLRLFIVGSNPVWMLTALSATSDYLQSIGLCGKALAQLSTNRHRSWNQRRTNSYTSSGYVPNNPFCSDLPAELFTQSISCSWEQVHYPEIKQPLSTPFLLLWVYNLCGENKICQLEQNLLSCCLFFVFLCPPFSSRCPSSPCWTVLQVRTIGSMHRHIWATFSL